MLKISDADLRDTIKVKRVSNSGQYVCDCPFCGKENHLYIDRATQLFHCKKCDESGNVYKLLKVFDRTFLLHGGKTIEQRDKLTSIRDTTTQEDTVETTEERITLRAVSMPVGWKVLNRSNRYLLSRGITPEICVRYKIGSTKILDKYKDYVIIPVEDNGVTVGWVGRYGNKRVPDGVLRYNNSLGNKFSAMLFGYDDIISGKTNTVILVEGIFDKIAVDRILELDNNTAIKCVCTFGKKTSNEQIHKLVDKGVKNILLLYDIDAINEIRKYGRILKQYFSNVSIVFTTKKDIDECTEAEALEVFERPMSVEDFSVNVIKSLKR